jgi:hypothetical protein
MNKLKQCPARQWGRAMADHTEWFEALSIEEAKEERIILRLWFGRMIALLSLLCVVAYATQYVSVN